MGQQKALKALDDPANLPNSMTAEQREAMESSAYGTLILNLSDSVLRQVIEEETSYKIWNKLNELYVSKDLPNKMYIREKFFTFKMDSGKNIYENLDDFKKITTEFKNLGEKLGDDNEVFILLNSLPESYKEVKTTLKYGRDSVTVSTIISAIRTREMELLSTSKDN